MNKINIDLEKFKEVYLNHGANYATEYFKCSLNTVFRYAKKLNINYTTNKRLHLPEELTPIQEQILIGSLFGDGCLKRVTAKRNSSFSEKHGMKQKDYLLMKYEILKPFSSKFYESTEKKTLYRKTSL